MTQKKKNKEKGFLLENNRIKEKKFDYVLINL